MQKLAMITIGSLLIAGSKTVLRAQGTPSAPSAPAAAASPLDGKSYNGILAPKGKKKGDKDDLVFKNGKFVSTACQKYGFNETSYQPLTENGKTGFAADVSNAKGETMSWKGWVEGEEISATAVYTDKKGKKKTYEFKPAQPKK